MSFLPPPARRAMACRADVAIAPRLDQHNHRPYLPRESSKHRWSECEYQMAHGFNGVFAVTVTSTLYANSGGQGCLAFGRLAVDHDGPEADASRPLAMGRMHGEMHGELHASRKCCRPEPRLTVTNWCRLEQKDREHQCWSIVCIVHYNIIYNITCQSFSSACIQTRAESERRVMKTIIKRHAIWNRLLAATGQPTTVRTSLLSSRVTYGVAGRAMFDAPLVGEKS